MATKKTSGVYIAEESKSPKGVVEVATAVPAFVGYTEKALNEGRSLENRPFRISSLAEFHRYFGGTPKPTFSINENSNQSDFTINGKSYELKQETGNYLLYYNLLMFFNNGGGSCYIVSVGDYETDISEDLLTEGISTLIKEREPTLLVIPETTLLPNSHASTKVQLAMLDHCGNKMKNRFAILDIYEGYKERNDPSGDKVAEFRDNIGTNFLDVGAAYYPWINTSIVQEKDINYLNMANKDVLQAILTEELIPQGEEKAKIQSQIEKITKKDLSPEDQVKLNENLKAISPTFCTILSDIRQKLNLLSPATCMAGIYTQVDASRGVWKAPANVSINSAISPSVTITDSDQENLNSPLEGKAVNAIRSFVEKGILVLGARTLDGNSDDWRYISVRRTCIMLEESIKISSSAYVFEPNDANTWVTMKTMISNFLTGIWKSGGLAGSSPEEAFSVQIGLGQTMTPEDILDGILRVTVLVAITRPAEFIEITFQQEMENLND